MKDTLYKPVIRFDAVFDIETENWDTFACGCLLTSSGHRFLSWNEEEFTDWLLGFSGMVWAHNGGRFDALWLCERLLVRGIKAQVGLAGGRIVRLGVQLGKGERLEVMDSFALVPLSLDAASEIGGIRKQKLSLPCNCGEDCGGYCSIRRRERMEPRHIPIVEQYLEYDCESLLTTLRTLQEFADAHSLKLAATIGSAAWSTANEECAIGKADWQVSKQLNQYNFCREGYYGGRVQVFRKRASKGYRYDINSAYPWALTQPIPVGKRRERYGPDAALGYMLGHPGIYRCVVSMGECFIPPLPHRGKERLAYPTGEFEGTWSLPEIRHAEECGAKIRAIVKAITWETEDAILQPFCERVWNLRDSVGKKSALGKWLKLYANSLTGKCAQKPEKEYVVLDTEKEETYCPANFNCQGGLLHSETRNCCPHRCTGKCGRWSPLGHTGAIWTRQRYVISACAHIQFAAYLTARTRIKLHEQLIDGPDDAVYCDTDSVYSLNPRTRHIGESLGDFLFEGTFAEFDAVAPKAYTFLNEQGKQIARCKGIPDAVENWNALFTGVEMERGVNTFKTAARASENGEKFFARKHTTRKLSPNPDRCGDRFVLQDGLTRAPVYPMER